MKSCIFLVIIILIPSSILAQTDSVKHSSSVILFGKGAYGTKQERYGANAVKLNLTALFSGLYGLHYERELNQAFSIEAGLGLTGRNFVGNALRKAIELDKDVLSQASPNFTEEFDEYDDDFDFKSRDAKIGFFVSALPRFYFGVQDGFDGAYVGLNIQYRKYVFEAYPLDPSAPQYSGDIKFKKGSNYSEFETNLVLAVIIGNQFLFDKAVGDMFIGLGINIIQGERRDIGYVKNPSSLSPDIAVIGTQPREVSQLFPYFEIGYKIGVFWK